MRGRAVNCAAAKPRFQPRMGRWHHESDGAEVAALFLLHFHRLRIAYPMAANRIEGNAPWIVRLLLMVVGIVDSV
jgi:hypothetical protein